jgi:hypothetical protein
MEDLTADSTAMHGMHAHPSPTTECIAGHVDSNRSPQQRLALSLQDTKLALKWLAAFHAAFWQPPQPVSTGNISGCSTLAGDSATSRGLRARLADLVESHLWPQGRFARSVRSCMHLPCKRIPLQQTVSVPRSTALCCSPHQSITLRFVRSSPGSRDRHRQSFTLAGLHTSMLRRCTSCGQQQQLISQPVNILCWLAACCDYPCDVQGATGLWRKGVPM